MPKVNISGMDKVAILRALWDNATPEKGQFNENMAVIAVDGPIDVFCERFIGANLSEFVANSDHYDARYGTGAFRKAIARFRQW